jgi:L-ascorbate metabolism protein UlaG (beta-lactamase superfamily)
VSRAESFEMKLHFPFLSSCGTIVLLFLLMFPAKIYAQNDSLKNLGHASMKIKTSQGMIIYIDPYAGSDYVDSADILLITHSHSDHNQQSLVKLKSTGVKITYTEAIISGVYKSFTISNVTIVAVAAYNTNHSKATCVGYVLEFNGIKLYHAGDTGNIPEMAELASRHLDYALLPIDGIYNMSPEVAMVAADSIKAKYYIPMHTMPPPDSYDDLKVARFNVPNKIILRNGETIALVASSTYRDEKIQAPTQFSLNQNYPNPFNPETTFRFSIPFKDYVSLIVYDLLGHRVATIVSENLPAGTHTRHWNPQGISSGIYFYRLSSGIYSETKKVSLIR